MKRNKTILVVSALLIGFMCCIPDTLLGVIPFESFRILTIQNPSSRQLPITINQEKPDFTAVWKKGIRKSVIIISFTSEQKPVNCYVYDCSPFNGGKLLKQVENISSDKIEIEMDVVMDVYICVLNQEDNIAAKWLKSGK